MASRAGYTARALGEWWIAGGGRGRSAAIFVASSPNLNIPASAVLAMLMSFRLHMKAFSNTHCGKMALHRDIVRDKQPAN